MTRMVMANQAPAAARTSIWRRARGVAQNRMRSTAAAMKGTDALPRCSAAVPADVVAREQQDLLGEQRHRDEYGHGPPLAERPV